MRKERKEVRKERTGSGVKELKEGKNRLLIRNLRHSLFLYEQRERERE